MLQRRLLQGQSGLRLILYGHVRGGAGSNLADERVNNSIGFGGDYGFPERHNPLTPTVAPCDVVDAARVLETQDLPSFSLEGMEELNGYTATLNLTPDGRKTIERFVAPSDVLTTAASLLQDSSVQRAMFSSPAVQDMALRLHQAMGSEGLEFALSHEQRDENLEQWQSERTTAFPEPNVEVTDLIPRLLDSPVNSSATTGQSEEGWMDEDPLIRDIPLPSVLLGGVTFTPEDAERQWMEFMSHLECPICHEVVIGPHSLDCPCGQQQLREETINGWLCPVCLGHATVPRPIGWFSRDIEARVMKGMPPSIQRTEWIRRHHRFQDMVSEGWRAEKAIADRLARLSQVDKVPNNESDITGQLQFSDAARLVIADWVGSASWWRNLPQAVKTRGAEVALAAAIIAAIISATAMVSSRLRRA